MRSTWGSMTRLGPNRYRLRYWADLGDGRGRVRHSETVRGTRAEARRRLSEREAEHGTDRPSMTLEQCKSMWWDPECRRRIAEGSMRESTLRVYESAWSNHVGPRWGDVQVSGIRPLDLQEWLLTLGKVNGKRSLQVMRGILRFAVLYEVVPTNVAANDYRLSGEQRRRSKTIWTASQVCGMADAVRGTCLEVPVIMCGLAGCRTGEALGFRAADCEPVESNGMEVMCCHVVGEVTSAGYQDHAKNPQSVRWAVVPEPWSLRLESLLSDGREWLCGGDRPPVRGTMNVAWRRAFSGRGELSAFPPGEMSGLRNSWRTYMRDELRVGRDVLEKMMGHAGRGVGEVHYYRPDREAFADEVSRAWGSYRSQGERDQLGPAD